MPDYGPGKRAAWAVYRLYHGDELTAWKLARQFDVSYQTGYRDLKNVSKHLPLEVKRLPNKAAVYLLIQRDPEGDDA